MLRVASVMMLSLLVVSGAWWATCGWDTSYDLAADGSAHGPYSAWQVAAFVLVLAAVAGWAGAGGMPVAGALAITVAATVNWSISAAATGEEPNLWPVGAVGVLAGALAGSVIVALLAQRLRPRADYRRSHDDLDH